MFRPGLVLEQRYHVDRHGQLTLKQLRLSVVNEMHTNSYSDPRLLIKSLLHGVQHLELKQAKDYEIETNKEYCKLKRTACIHDLA